MLHCIHIALSSPTRLEGSTQEARIITGGTSQQASLTRAAAKTHTDQVVLRKLSKLPGVRVPLALVMCCARAGAKSHEAVPVQSRLSNSVGLQVFCVRDS